MALVILIGQEKGYINDVAFILLAIIGLMGWIVKCERCGTRGIVLSTGKLLPSFAFYFGSRCPNCDLERR